MKKTCEKNDYVFVDAMFGFANQAVIKRRSRFCKNFNVFDNNGKNDRTKNELGAQTVCEQLIGSYDGISIDAVQ